MQVLMIVGNMPDESPYIQYYIQVFKDLNIAYNIVAWDRGNTPKITQHKNTYVYKKQLSNRASLLKKIWGYWLFSRFVKNQAKLLKCESVIIFTIPTILYYYNWLNRKYKNRYIFDIRDYSTYYKIPFVKKIIDKTIKRSYTTSISSPGFLCWLPPFSNKYTISHNISRYLLPLMDTHNTCSVNNGIIKILTIGQIRDPEANFAITQAICADKMMRMTFIGYGPGMDDLRLKVSNSGINNVEFKGAYDKKDEPEIVDCYDMINAYMPNNILSNTLMSNRFYLSVIHGKPIIVSKGSTQAYYVTKFNLGVVISLVDNIADNIRNYWEHFNLSEYNDGRRRFMEVVKCDYDIFDHKIKEFITK